LKGFCELIIDDRKHAGLTQRELSARIMLEDGRQMSPPYLNDFEHNLRKPPRTSAIKQFANVLRLQADFGQAASI
jgi:transcriptional regulator with XRE-family HTH domain